ncbi:ribonuclease D [Paludisphaera mucosa]|uniref:HRDC domain-containing protein n=1 Tax=Paludisphaera mucosa TaxID=3030827 RepID=A0ABT6FFM5_9BACT|nr:HRDC domain-containing protein [Paludisphaera mucosa]MDG3006382.1 HRDC domain-containing protein [Paludisphaera mucosa]
MPDSRHESLIADAAGLNDLIDHIREERRFGFDTEFVSEDTYEPVLCLIQVATSRRLAAVDPLALAAGDLDAFWAVVLDPEIEVVMHAAGEDMRICLMRTGKLPARVFDVQLAAGLVGYSYPLSHTNLVSQVLRATVSGSETRTDWRRRPLTPAQVRYALDDVRYLLDLQDRLGAELDRLGRREWAEAEFRDFMVAVEERADQDRWRRLPGLHQLSRRALEAARRLSEWREGEARRQNRPMRQVMRDDLVVAIAKRMPNGRRDLEALRDFNRPGLISRADEILKAVEAARGVPDDQLPEPAPRHDDAPGASTVANLLSAALAQCCLENKVAGSLVANTSDLKSLIRWRLDGCPGGERPILAEGWRGEMCGGLLLDVLDGRRTLRVVDPASEFPVALEPTRTEETPGR